eukprot:scaffold296400_cov79-Cyclotella_meneghiniana.AAC.3
MLSQPISRSLPTYGHPLCRRLQGVTDVYIYSLVQLQSVITFGDEGITSGNILSIDHETTIRSVPFLSMMGFPKLERVFFGGVSNDEAHSDDASDDESSREDESSGQVELVPYVDYPDDDFSFHDVQPLMASLIDSMAGAFKVGALSSNLIIRGLRCLNDGNGECQACRHACESFPLESVACFECRGSSQDQVRSGRSFDLDVCLKREEVEKIFLSRNDSNESLYSKDHSQLQEIGRVILHLDDISSLKSTQISQAIMKSFSNYEICLLSKKSREGLQELGLQQNISDMEGCFIQIVELIACGEVSHDPFLSCQCLSIVSDCMYSSKNLANEIVQDAYAFLAALRQFLQGYNSCPKEKSAEILTLTLLRYGVNTKREWASTIGQLVSSKSTQHLAPTGSETEAILFLVDLLKHVNMNEGSSAFYILTEIIQRKKNESISTIVVAGGIGQLVPYIAKDIRRTLSALSTIARSSKGHRSEVFGSGVMQTLGTTSSFGTWKEWICLIHVLVIDEDDTINLQRRFRCDLSFDSIHEEVCFTRCRREY